MANRRIRIELKGMPQDMDRLRLHVLAKKLEALHSTLSHIDWSIAGAHSLYFRVTRLSQSSPALIEVEAVPREEQQDTSAAVVDKFMDDWNCIIRGQEPARVDYAALSHYRNLARGFNREISEMSITADEKAVSIPDSVEPALDMILRTVYVVHGAASGMLETINVHGGKREFYIYPVAGADKVECRFGDALLKQAISAITRRVKIEGRLKYRKRALFPHAIDVESMRVYPPESELPRLIDLRGIAPNATGNLSSEEFVRRLREDE